MRSSFRGWCLAALLLVLRLAFPEISSAQSPTAASARPPSGATEAQAALVKLVDQVMRDASVLPSAAATFTVERASKGATAPQRAAADIDVSWRNDFLKAQGGGIYVPFTVGVKPGALESTSVIVYLRVAPKDATGPSAPDASRPAAAASSSESLYPYEDIYTTELRGATTHPELQVSRAFAVPPGTYDVYVALRSAPGLDEKPSATFTATVLKRAIKVPDLWNEGLTTSTIMVADRVEPLAAPLTPDALRERPYVLGAAEFTPAPDAEVKKTEDLRVFFQIYNPSLGDDKKPDVTVDYKFMKVEATGESFFNTMQPQVFNTRTLPPTFDAQGGSQISAGWSVPLASFPPGEYRLDIQIVDTKAGKSISRAVTFTVVGAS